MTWFAIFARRPFCTSVPGTTGIEDSRGLILVHRLSRRAIIVAVTLGLCGCATVGPQSITAGRGIYNEVINRTEDEQILNALVRLRYDETFGMISVASVTANLKFKAHAVAQAGFGDSVNYAGNLVPLTAGVAYEENPTISYVPLSGEDFMRRMISPLSVNEWVLMSQPIKRKDLLIALVIHRVNALRNPFPGEGHHHRNSYGLSNCTADCDGMP